jgi:hypothetical protein
MKSLEKFQEVQFLNVQIEQTNRVVGGVSWIGDDGDGHWLGNDTEWTNLLWDLGLL